MNFTIIDTEVFETMLKEIDHLTEKVAILHQNHGDKGLQKWLTNQDVCHILSISKCTLQAYRDKGELPFSRIIRTFYYKPEDVKLLLINSQNKKAWK